MSDESEGFRNKGNMTRLRVFSIKTHRGRKKMGSPNLSVYEVRSNLGRTLSVLCTVVTQSYPNHGRQGRINRIK